MSLPENFITPGDFVIAVRNDPDLRFNAGDRFQAQYAPRNTSKHNAGLFVENAENEQIMVAKENDPNFKPLR